MTWQPTCSSRRRRSGIGCGSYATPPVIASRIRGGSPNSLWPERVCEVAYDQMEGDRFRHAVTFRRWRPDRDPASCTFDQLDVPATYDLYDVLESSGASEATGEGN